MLALASDGTVFSFGLNRHGQLGLVANAGLWGYNWQPAQIPPSALGGSLVGVGNLAAGSLHSLVLSNESHVWAFGSNGWGQLGSPENAGVWGGYVFSPRKVMEGVVQVAAGAKHSVLRTSQVQRGHVVCSMCSLCTSTYYVFSPYLHVVSPYLHTQNTFTLQRTHRVKTFLFVVWTKRNDFTLCVGPHLSLTPVLCHYPGQAIRLRQQLLWAACRQDGHR